MDKQLDVITQYGK